MKSLLQVGNAKIEVEGSKIKELALIDNILLHLKRLSPSIRKELQEGVDFLEQMQNILIEEIKNTSDRSRETQEQTKET